MFRDADPPARAGARPMSRTGKSARLPGVLVVDDEVRSQEALRRTLDEEFEVFTASSADEAWRIMERESVQVLLCDQRMPGESGVGFLKRVRAQWPDVVRLIISGYTDSEDIIAGINEAGIYQYLLKPWQPDTLLMAIRNAAELFRLQAENQRLSLELRTSGAVLRKRVEMKYERVKREFGLDGLARAIISLPVPDSPEMSTDRSKGATWAIRSHTGFSGLSGARVRPSSPNSRLTRSYFISTRFLSTGPVVRSSRLRRWFSACRRCSSAALRMAISRLSGCQGLSRYW